MEKDVNLHQGHRERMFKKVLSSADALADHELLEILLFGMIPRVDTNPIAHRLLNTFGKLEKVFSASVKELTSVNGVGEKVATQIFVMGKVFSRIKEKQANKETKPDLSFHDVRKRVLEDFSNGYTERFKIYLLDEKFVQITAIEFDDNESFEVSVDVSQLAKILALHKPTFVIIAHNHLSGSCEPSTADDLTTRKIHLLCSIHGATLADHVIVSGNDVYSYKHEERLVFIKETADLKRILS